MVISWAYNILYIVQLYKMDMLPTNLVMWNTKKLAGNEHSHLQMDVSIKQVGHSCISNNSTWPEGAQRRNSGLRNFCILGKKTEVSEVRGGTPSHHPSHGWPKIFVLKQPWRRLGICMTSETLTWLQWVVWISYLKMFLGGTGLFLGRSAGFDCAKTMDFFGLVIPSS